MFCVSAKSPCKPLGRLCKNCFGEFLVRRHIGFCLLFPLVFLLLVCIYLLVMMGVICYRTRDLQHKEYVLSLFQCEHQLVKEGSHFQGL